MAFINLCKLEQNLHKQNFEQNFGQNLGKILSILIIDSGLFTSILTDLDLNCKYTSEVVNQIHTKCTYIDE